MNSNMIDIIVNQGLGVVIGTVVSFVVSWYFFRKADLPTQVAAKMLEEVRLMIILDRLSIPADFDHMEEIDQNQIPKNKDVPHVVNIYHQKRKIKQGESCCILFRVVDDGSNFTGNIEVQEESSKLIFSTQRQGFGYYSCIITMPVNAQPAIHSIRIKLTDTTRKSHLHHTRIAVEPIDNN